MLGICAIVFCWLPIVPVILASIGFVMYSSAKKQGFIGGILTGALIVNIIGIIFSVLYMIIWIAVIGLASYASSYYTYF